MISMRGIAWLSLPIFNPDRMLFLRWPLLFVNVCFLCLLWGCCKDQPAVTPLHYTVSASQAASHILEVTLTIPAQTADTLTVKLPRWTPGYYQYMPYAHALKMQRATDASGKTIPLIGLNENTWQLSGCKDLAIQIHYTTRAEEAFVAKSYADSSHVYILPAATFLYLPGRLHEPAAVTLDMDTAWQVATGLTPDGDDGHTYTATDFDILYDCPILAGSLAELPAFTVQGIPHRFLAYQAGSFDQDLFMQKLQRVVAAGVDIMGGDIPYTSYTFIGIGPGRGGIEHLNNTTVSFDGNTLDSPEAMNHTMNFLAHEYFHHYNVKRIRPMELGPFDYDEGNRTNLLWVSEGLTVYYEHLMVKRAGLVNDTTLLSFMAAHITEFENDPGKKYQSLIQASYDTWLDGPFGQGEGPDRAISYYEKGPIVGLLLDFAIRHATHNAQSLDDVMRLVYHRYYKMYHRGFTDAEFQQACETVAGTSLRAVFEYVYTTQELAYDTYLAYAGLQLEAHPQASGLTEYTLKRLPVLTPQQAAIYAAWCGE